MTESTAAVAATNGASSNRKLLATLDDLTTHQDAKLRVERHPIERLNADMIFREMSSVQRGALEERHFRDDGEGNSVMTNRQEWRAACCALTWVDSEDPDSAERVAVGDEAIATVNRIIPASAMDEIYVIVSRMNKLKKEDQETEKGNSVVGDGIVRSRLSPSIPSTASQRNTSNEPPVTAEPPSSSDTSASSS